MEERRKSAQLKFRNNTAQMKTPFIVCLCASLFLSLFLSLSAALVIVRLHVHIIGSWLQVMEMVSWDCASIPF